MDNSIAYAQTNAAVLAAVVIIDGDGTVGN
jgi:hypothetical protein